MKCLICGNEMQEGGLIADGVYVGWTPLEDFQKKGLKRLTHGPLRTIGESSVFWSETLVPNAFFCKSCNKVIGVFDVTNHLEEKEK